MFKRIFSKLLTILISLEFITLICCGGVAAIIFRTYSLNNIQTELTGEVNAINRIVVGEYLDSRQYAVAMEKLYAISRQYGALILVLFNNQNQMNANIVDNEYSERWSGVESSQYTEYIDGLLASANVYNYAYDILREITGNRTLTVSKLILSADGARQGIIAMTYDLTSIYGTLNKLYGDILIFAAIALIIAIPIALFISNRITHPITELNSAITKFSKGDFESRVVIEGHDEIAVLADNFNRMATEISQAESQRRTFVANVSHELRSPLTSIHGFIEAMSDGTIPEDEYSKYLPVLLDETGRMSRLITDLLDLSRIESGKSIIHKSSFDINELILKVLLTFEARLNKKQPELILPTGGVCTVYADENKLTQVLNNLFDNAIRYLPESGGKLRVAVKNEHSITTVAIGNNGEMIPQDNLPHVFERFYKVDKARTRTGGGGTGLGLSIAKLIINEHGGDIGVTSDENETVFTFTIKSANANGKENR